MSDAASRGRILDPAQRFEEIAFGLIMVLTFTGSTSVAEAGHGEVRTMLVQALGCNLAWGIVDGVMYLVAALTERARAVRLHEALLGVHGPEEARRALASSLPDAVAGALGREELDDVLLRVATGPPPPRARLVGRDLRGAVGVFLLVFLSTLPVALPFVVFDDAVFALRVSNAVALTLLFLAGASLGRYAGFGSWRAGFAMLFLGAGLVGVTIALGG